MSLMSPTVCFLLMNLAGSEVRAYLGLRQRLYVYYLEYP